MTCNIDDANKCVLKLMSSSDTWLFCFHYICSSIYFSIKKIQMCLGVAVLSSTPWNPTMTLCCYHMVLTGFIHFVTHIMSYITAQRITAFRALKTSQISMLAQIQSLRCLTWVLKNLNRNLFRSDRLKFNCFAELLFPLDSSLVVSILFVLKTTEKISSFFVYHWKSLGI
jgi:hypothetical protein